VSQPHGVIGFTEAELGFFLVFAMLLFSVVGRRHPTKEIHAVDSVQVTHQLLDSLRQRGDSVQVLTRARDSLRAALALLPDTTKRSRVTPSCQEKGIIAGPLFDITVLGENAFRIGEDFLDISGVRQRFEVDLARASAADCRHVARIFFPPNLSAALLQDGMRRLSAFVYVRVIGS
jgi:hypothetical protein